MVICLMGSSNVGKDTLQNIISAKCNIPICVSSTTRPMREGEIDGKTYHFISTEQFLSDFKYDKFLETREYETANGIWYYGLSRESVANFDTQITIVDEQGFYAMESKLGKDNILGFYIYAPERVKIQRALNRESRNDDKFFEELYRRLLDDMKAFNRVKTDSRIFKIENLDLQESVSEILTYLQIEGVIA